VSLVYLAALLVSITGMAVLDRRFRLFFWSDARRAAIVLASGVVLFLVWDLLGIGLGIFFRGQTPFMTGVLVAPEVPVEEIFFLVLLCYLSMNVFAAASRLHRPTVPEPVEGHHPENAGPVRTSSPTVPGPVEGHHPENAGPVRTSSPTVPEPVEGHHPAKPHRLGDAASDPEERR
jgi:lycopene cyclase domain-containing protein